MGNIVIAGVQAADKAPQALVIVHIILTGVDQTDIVADVIGHVGAGLDAYDAAVLALHRGVDQLDQLLGLTGAVGTHNQSNHKKSLLYLR